MGNKRIIEIQKIKRIKNIGYRPSIILYLAVKGIPAMLKDFETIMAFKKACNTVCSPNHVRARIKKLLKVQDEMGKVGEGDLPSLFRELKEVVLEQFEKT